MKRTALLPFLAVALLAICLARPCHAKEDNPGQTALPTDTGIAVMDPAEEAHKIRHLVKFALASDASAASHTVLDDEIKIVEKDKKFKMKVLTELVQDDDPDPSLPKVVLVKYPDGAIRGLLFIQTDKVKGKPNQLAWAIDPKREKKESGQ
ncbi:MAG TPA: hypothetical protein VG733_15975 [Chthoniobacteraceae bacterium]|nr:hypothetical protein [Chthoniobacteraceae bacterium]